MANPVHTTSGTQVPHESGGFPPFKTETFPAQIFWLTITFAVLFVVMWRFVLPKLGAIVGDRQAKIAGDLALAQTHKQDAELASAAYDAAITAARKRALAAANDNRQAIAAEVEKAKAAAEAKAAQAMAEAEIRINASRSEARSHVTDAARDAAIAIVSRLTGNTVSPADAEAAVRASQS